MHKKVLTEQSLYFGDVKMPKHWEIDSNDLAHHILHSSLNNTELQFSKTWDKLDTYIKNYQKDNLNFIQTNTYEYI